MDLITVFISIVAVILIGAGFAVSVAILPMPFVVWFWAGARKLSAFVNRIFPSWLRGQVKKHETHSLYAPGENFTYLKLVRENFENSDLPNANFANAHLQDVNFKHTNLWHANFKNTEIKNVDFTDSDLEKVDFRNAKLENVTLKGADLRGAVYNRNTVLPFDRKIAREKGMVYLRRA